MKKHTLRISDKHWEMAERLAAKQAIRTTASAILTHAIERFFEPVALADKEESGHQQNKSS